MSRFFGAVITALAMGSAAVAQTQAPVNPKPGTEKVTGQEQANAKNLVQDVTATGCIRLWKPNPGDPTKMPSARQPGLAGVYLLTPVASTPSTQTDLPTYLLTPSATQNFWQHVGHQVTITGMAQTAPMPPTVQEIATAPTLRPEEKPSTAGMPRLTVTTMTMVSESCP